MDKLTLRNCRFCTEVAKQNGEDPIGTTETYDHWLIFELPLPWAKTIWMEPNPVPQHIHEALAVIWQEDIRLRPLAIAPDREYSQPHLMRVLYYHKPAGAFARLTKYEYLLPLDAVAPLIFALFKQPQQLATFAAYQQKTQHIRDLLVCTHGNVDAACARFGYPIYRQLRQQYASQNLRVWRCSHFGYHQFAPTLLDMPEGRCWGQLEPDVLELLIRRSSSVTGLRSYYQGWAGLTKFEQIAEREILMLEGWAWLDYLKQGKVLAVDEIHIEPEWAEIQIDFASSGGSIFGAYQARIEVSGQVTTAWWTSTYDDDEPLVQVKQYRVSRLVKVI
ncbi:sucrase ferredoxin [Gloeocapsopsis sp. IPPAS B-1203]|uniref:sucrase ferredoxin n=1 Tax=Gloeocapsopsis sp. IPPAS B-1203 TaxID=2049454 RepID=UPI000C191D09|nr:sucrase ferredoxin [Gloeocapsopsis sp. IPPAS B-1203]PIG94611.1 sucrase ferredoxin [Gloeocapsopsis sp. IPPAS B-1203]